MLCATHRAMAPPMGLWRHPRQQRVVCWAADFLISSVDVISWLSGTPKHSILWSCLYVPQNFLDVVESCCVLWQKTLTSLNDLEAFGRHIIHTAVSLVMQCHCTPYSLTLTLSLWNCEIALLPSRNNLLPSLLLMGDAFIWAIHGYRKRWNLKLLAFIVCDDGKKILVHIFQDNR